MANDGENKSKWSQDTLDPAVLAALKANDQPKWLTEGQDIVSRPPFPLPDSHYYVSVSVDSLTYEQSIELLEKARELVGGPVGVSVYYANPIAKDD